MNRVRAAVVVVMLLVPGAWAHSASTSPLLTLDPLMTKGAATAPVTIVEFSDYQ
jgi:hypothetical protein